MKIAIVTQAIGNGGHIKGVETLFYSLDKFNDLFDIDLIYVTDVPYTSPILTRLKAKNTIIDKDYSFINSDRVPGCEKKFFNFTFKDYDRLIIIDADVMCLKSISYLFSEELNSKQIWGIRCPGTYVYFRERAEKLKLQLLNILNAGVLVINKPLLDYIHDDIIGMIREGNLKAYEQTDQGYLNHYIQKKDIPIGFLTIEYNYVMDVATQSIEKESIRLLHHTGPKPWTDWKESPGNKQYPGDLYSTIPEYKLYFMNKWQDMYKESHS